MCSVQCIVQSAVADYFLTIRPQTLVAFIQKHFQKKLKAKVHAFSDRSLIMCALLRKKSWQANLISAMSANRNREWKSLLVWEALLSIDAHNTNNTRVFDDIDAQSLTLQVIEVLEIATPPVRQLLLICKPGSHCRGAFSTLSVTFSDRSSLVCWQSYSFTFPIWTVPLLVHLFTFNCAVGKEWWNKRWWYQDNAKYESTHAFGFSFSFYFMEVDHMQGITTSNAHYFELSFYRRICRTLWW